jgi:YbbR domain-containing protein
MVRRAWKVITNNIGLKILAAVFAVILWLVVVNVDDPKISQRFSASVVIENSEYLTDQGKYFEVLNDTNTIVFTVTAKRSYIEKLSNTDFKAVANMENAAIDNETGTGKVPIEVSALRYSTLVTISKATQNLEIALDNLAQEQFIVETDTTGTLPDGCALGEVSASPNLLKVSGPESVVSRIDHVTASVDLTNMTTDIVASVIPVLYDSEGNAIDKNELTLNMSTVTVTARILDIKDVSLIFNVTGTPASGYAYMDMEYTPQTISIKGTASALNSVTALNIPESALDISGARGDITQVIDVTEYLPSGVTIADKSQSKVTVTVHIAELSTRVVNIFPSSIQVLHLPEDYELTFDSAVIRVVLSGIEADINALDVGSIVASIDAGQLSPGTHEVELALELEDNIYHEPVTVIVTLSEKNEPGEADEPEAQEPDDETEAPTETETTENEE